MQANSLEPDSWVTAPPATQMLPVSGISFDIQSICRKDSTEITDADRYALCAAVRQTTSTRIVVTHGTDTMIETAAYVLQSGAAMQPRRRPHRA